LKETKTKSGTVMTGLWPLDVVSYHDWQSMTHATKVFTEYTVMARMEIHLIWKYRANLFSMCGSAVFIQ
jgi:hypothetical protein